VYVVLRNQQAFVAEFRLFVHCVRELLAPLGEHQTFALPCDTTA
jgi:hypothetical protein